MQVSAEVTAPTAGHGLTMQPVDQYGVRHDRMLLWKTQGFVAPEATSAEDILERAGLNWDVELLPLTVPDPSGSGVITDPKRKVIVRSDTHQPLGVAKTRYVPASNREVLSFMDTIFDSGQAKFEAAWDWRGGESIGVAMRIPDEITVAGVDKYGLYILARTSHDGGGSVVIAATPVRLACTNMTTIALKAAHRTFRAPHVSSLAGRVTEARQSLDVAFEYVKAWEVEVEKLLEVRVNEGKVKEVVKTIFGEKHIDPVIDLWGGLENIKDYRDTRYGAFNAITEYAQWIRPRDAQLESALRGPIAHQTDRAFQLLAV